MAIIKTFNYTYSGSAESLSNPADDVDTISDAQSIASPFYFTLNGGASTAGDRNGICASQSHTGALAMIINGAASSQNPVTHMSYVKYSVPRTIAFYSGSNNSARTLTVKGLGVNGVEQTEEIAGPNNSYTVSTYQWTQISTVYSDGTISSLELGDGYGYQDLGSLLRLPNVTSDGNDSGRTVSIIGTDYLGNALTETLTGPNSGTVLATNYFKTISAVKLSGAGTGSLSVGWQAGIRVMINPQLSMLNNWYTVEGDNSANAHISVIDGSTSSATGSTLLEFDPGGTADEVNYPNIGGDGIRFATTMSFDMPNDADLLKSITLMYSG